MNIDSRGNLYLKLCPITESATSELCKDLNETHGMCYGEDSSSSINVSSWVKVYVEWHAVNL